jgi:hypothetical protein
VAKLKRIRKVRIKRKKKENILTRSENNEYFLSLHRKKKPLSIQTIKFFYNEQDK